MGLFVEVRNEVSHLSVPSKKELSLPARFCLVFHCSACRFEDVDLNAMLFSVSSCCSRYISSLCASQVLLSDADSWTYYVSTF